jgi:hypothetical protein
LSVAPRRSKVDAGTQRVAGPPPRQEPENTVVRDASVFLWTVLERAGSPSLREAAVALYPGGPAAPELEDMLRHVLRVAVAGLCDAASVRLTGEPPPAPADDGIGSVGAAEVARSAERVVSAIERAAWEELAEAHSYFLAPPWSRELAERRPSLAGLAFSVVRFMIDCAWQWADEHLPPPRR